MTRLHVIIPGDPVPYTRARFNTRTGNVYTPQKYRAWKEGAALLIKSAARGKKFYFSNGIGWSYRDSKVRVRMNLYTATRRGDWDNYYKAALDAIVKSGVILNDNRTCVGPPLDGTDAIDMTNPRIELEILAVRISSCVPPF